LFYAAKLKKKKG